jgi:AcrR family transcriptional regulator
VVDAGDDVRGKLLDAAVGLYAEQGIAATTVAQVARHAGVTGAMVHYYFKNREQLTDAVFLERVLRFRDLVWHEDEDFQPTQPKDADLLLGLLIRRVIAATEELPWLPNLWVKEVLNESGLLRERLMKHFPVQQLQGVAQAVAREQRAGRMNRELQPLLAVVSVFGLTLMLLATRKVWGRLPGAVELDNTKLERHIVSLLQNGWNGRKS